MIAQTQSPSIFAYFTDSNFAGKIIVLALIVFSLMAWTVMIGKYLDLKRLQSLNTSLEAKLKDASSITAIHIPSPVSRFGPYASLLGDATEVCSSAGAGINHVENALQRGVAELTTRYESKMVFLASIVTGAPFMGLLGTVWGVMDAFGSVGLQNSASLQTLAPGVSGALLTTVAALLVAIPSVFGYNFLLTRTKIMVTELENFASRLADRIELELEG
ncbi:MAG TPA: flagellar motor protein MotA [Opitutae bacterium]|nr:flagellar motor protein MotA [Opitutae bacterium]